MRQLGGFSAAPVLLAPGLCAPHRLSILSGGLLDCWANLRVDVAMALWEQILLGVLALLVLFWMGPGARSAMERSRDAPRDWRGVLIPVGLVVLFVFLLISVVRN